MVRRGLPILFGLLLFVIAAALSLWVPPTVGFWSKLRGDALVEARRTVVESRSEVGQNILKPTFMERPVRRSVLRTMVTISYEAPILVNEQLRVLAEVEQIIVHKDSEDCERHYTCGSVLPPTSVKRLKSGVRLSLASPSFHIDESEKEKTVRAGAPLPVEIDWLALPKREGTHLVRFDLSEVHTPPRAKGANQYIPPGAFIEGQLPEFAGPPSNAQLMINGRPVSDPDFSQVLLEVAVRPWSGLPPLWHNIIAVLGVTAGLVLTAWGIFRPRRAPEAA